jgi:hypothetical protein
MTLYGDAEQDVRRLLEVMFRPLMSCFRAWQVRPWSSRSPLSELPHTPLPERASVGTLTFSGAECVRCRAHRPLRQSANRLPRRRR